MPKIASGSSVANLANPKVEIDVKTECCHAGFGPVLAGGKLHFIYSWQGGRRIRPEFRLLLAQETVRSFEWALPSLAEFWH